MNTRTSGSLLLHARADDVPGMTPDEYDSLVLDIEQRGIVTPLDILDDGTIIDGRHRWQAAAVLGLPEVPVRVIAPADPFVYMLKAAMERRHLTKSQRAMLALRLDEYVAARRSHGGDRRSVQVATLPLEASGPAPWPECWCGAHGPHAHAEPAGKSRDVAAASAKVSPRLVQDAKAVQEKAPELARRVMAGEMTVSQAARQVRREEDRAKAAAAPPVTEHVDGQRYRCIVIDPPWDPGDEGDVDQMGRAQPTYATMPIDQVRELPVSELADPDGCHLYLWITNRSLPKGFALLEAWGFRYVTTLTWCKPSIGVGNYWRNNTEHVLFGVKGKLGLLRQDHGTWFAAPRGGRHSEKPDEFYDLVRSATPGPRIDLFNRRELDGFARWGSEVAA